MLSDDDAAAAAVGELGDEDWGTRKSFVCIRVTTSAPLLVAPSAAPASQSNGPCSPSDEVRASA